MSEKTASPKLELTLEDFKTMVAETTAAAVAAAIAEQRKPSDKELKEIEQINEERKANAAYVKRQMEETRAFQKICAHNQNKNRDAAKTACVYVDQDFPKMPNGGRYLLCQQCGVKIVPGPAPEGVDKWNQPFAIAGYLYDTPTFIKHFQMLNLNE